MNKILMTMMMGAALIAFQPAVAQDEAAPKMADKQVALIGNNQQEIGSVLLQEGPKGMILTVEVKGMSEGWHGFHIHETGDCSDGDKFSTAGSHMTSGEHQNHGLLDEAGAHAGDLPNIWVGETGTGKAQFFAPQVTLEMLDDDDGSAFVFHEDHDDYQTETSGNSGARVACGVIYPVKT